MTAHPNAKHQVLHGGRALAARITANRLEPRTRRMLRKIEQRLAAEPLEGVRDLTVSRIARRELIAQRVELHLLGDDLAEGGRWLLGLWAAQRRDIELLALLEQRRAGDATPTLSDYLRTAEQRRAAPAASHAVTDAVPADAEDGRNPKE